MHARITESNIHKKCIKYIWEKSVEKKMDYYHDMYGNLTSLQIEFGMEHKAKVRMAT